MNSRGGATAASDLSASSKRPTSREVSSKFLSPTSIADNGNRSPNSALLGSSRTPRSYDASGFFRGLWPTSTPDSEPRKRNSTTDDHHHRLSSLSRQRSHKYSFSKENQKPLTGGSMRYAEIRNDIIVPGRFSVDEGRSPFSLDEQEQEQEQEQELSYMAPTVSSRKHGIQVPSKFMHDRRWSADSGTNGSSRSKADDGKKKKSSESSGVRNILSRGMELLKGKKSSFENVHQLRMLHNRLVQWRYTSARAEAVDANVIKRAECSLICVWNGLVKLRLSVLQKRLELQKEKLEIKLNYIIHSQIKDLENWGDVEPQHIAAVRTTVDYLHHVVCRLPLGDGAKVEPQSASIMIRRASDIAQSIELTLTTLLPTIEKTVGVAGELATVVTQEKLLLDECFELFRNISVLEIQERSLKSSIIQLRLLQQHVHDDTMS